MRSRRPFAENPHEGRGRQPKISGREIEHLLNARARIVEERQQDIVSLPGGAVTIDLAQEVCQLVLAEIPEHGLGCFLHRDREHALTQTRERRFGVDHITKEAVYSGQSRVPRPNAVVPRDFEMAEKLQDQRRGQILDV